MLVRPTKLPAISQSYQLLGLANCHRGLARKTKSFVVASQRYLTLKLWDPPTTSCSSPHGSRSALKWAAQHSNCHFQNLSPIQGDPKLAHIENREFCRQQLAEPEDNDKGGIWSWLY